MRAISVAQSGLKAVVVAGVVGTAGAAAPVQVGATPGPEQHEISSSDAPSYCHVTPATTQSDAMGNCFDTFAELLTFMGYSGVPADLEPEPEWFHVGPFDLEGSDLLPSDRPYRPVVAASYNPSTTALLLGDLETTPVSYTALGTGGAAPNTCPTGGPGIGDLGVIGWSDRVDGVYGIQCDAGKFWDNIDYDNSGGYFADDGFTTNTNWTYFPIPWWNRVTSLKVYP